MEKWLITLANKESKNMEHHSPAYYLDLFERYENEKRIQYRKVWKELCKEGKK